MGCFWSRPAEGHDPDVSDAHDSSSRVQAPVLVAPALVPIGADGPIPSSQSPATAKQHRKDIHQLRRLLKKKNLRFVGLRQAWLNGLPPLQRQAIERVLEDQQCVRVAKGKILDVWATLLGVLRLQQKYNVARLRPSADGTSRQGLDTKVAGPDDGSGSSTQQQPTQQQQHSQEQQQQQPAKPGMQATSANASSLETGAGSTDSAPAAPAVIPHPGSSSSNTNCCFYHDLRIEPLTDFTVASPAGSFDMVVKSQEHEVKLVELHSIGVRLPQQVDVSLELQIQACSNDMNEAWSIECLRVPQLAAKVTEVAASGQPQSSSSSANVGTSMRCCWGGVGHSGPVEIKPFVSRMRLTMYAQTEDSSAGHSWPVQLASSTGCGSLLIDENVVEMGQSQMSRVAQSASRTAGAMLQAGVNPEAQIKFNANTHTTPVSGASVAKYDNVLVSAGGTTAEVTADYPEDSNPVSLGVDRNLPATLICNQEAAFGELSSNPCYLDKYDIIFKVPISPPSELPTVAIKMAVTAEVGLFKYPADGDGSFVDNVSRFVVLKDADVGVADLGSGISIDVGSRTTKNFSGTCKVHK